MARSGSITLPWADGDYTFRLPWGQLMELQEQCGAGPFVILTRLGNGQWKVQDVAHVIRLGLIGGGTEPAKALSLTRDYVESRPPVENVMFARGILGAAVIGAPDEKPGEAREAPKDSGSMTSQTENSASP